MTQVMGLLFACSEIALAVAKRAKSKGARPADSGSLRMLWIVIVSSMLAGFSLPFVAPGLAVSSPRASWIAGVVLFTAGLVLRWYAISYLGKFFTVDVAIAADHRLVDGGPYRYIRHPSYSGILLIIAGIAVSLDNWGSLLVMLLPTFLAFSRRMRVEERALSSALGSEYLNYTSRTKRLVPGIY